MKVRTMEDLQALIDQKTPEDGQLEFKGGGALGASYPNLRESVAKDVSAFANAGGGCLIYGIKEKKVLGASIAVAIDPVTNQTASEDWLTQIISSSTAPPLRLFQVFSINVDGGMVLVVEVEPSYTAHQNRVDKRYYRRTAATSTAMEDFEIRDVMNRRTGPVLELDCSFQLKARLPTKRIFVAVPTIRNIGGKTLRDWHLQILVPDLIFIDNTTSFDNDYIWFSVSAPGQRGYSTFELSSQHLHNRSDRRLLPQQNFEVSLQAGIGEILLVVEQFREDELRTLCPAIFLRLYADDCAPIERTYELKDWFF